MLATAIVASPEMLCVTLSYGRPVPGAVRCRPVRERGLVLSQ